MIRHTRLLHGNDPNGNYAGTIRNVSNGAPRAQPSYYSPGEVEAHVQFDRSPSDAMSAAPAPSSHSPLIEPPENRFETQGTDPRSTNTEFPSFPENPRQVPNPTQRSSLSHEYQNFANPNVEMLDGQMDNMLYNNIVNNAISATGTKGIVGTSNVLQEYNLFLDDYHTANFYLPAALLDSDLPTSLWSQPDWNSSVTLQNQSSNSGPSQNENDSLSRFGSRLPSLQPEEQNQEREYVPQAYSRSIEPPWKISGQDYREIQLKIAEFQAVLPGDFSLPSRHALSRFLEGYISGFHRHLPFLHIPTFDVTRCVPELLLAICAVGAQYRFESWTANHLWYAARAVAMEQKRMRNSQVVAALKSPAPFRRSTSHHSPGSGRPGQTSMDGQSLDAWNPETLGDLRYVSDQIVRAPRSGISRLTSASSGNQSPEPDWEPSKRS